MGMSLLVIQPSTKCDGGCLICPWREKFGCTGVMLPPEVVDILAENLDGFRFDECVITCPNPFSHPKIDVIVNKTQEICDRIDMFITIPGLKNVARSGQLKKISDNVHALIILVDSQKAMMSSIQTIKNLLSFGVDNIEAYIPLGSSFDFAEILSLIGICRRLGLRITVGPRFYEKAPTEEFLKKLAKRENTEVGLHYGIKYIYHALKVFFDDYPVTLLTSPSSENCKTIYVNPYGNVSKCPHSKLSINYRHISTEYLRKMLFSPCPLSQNALQLTPKVKVSFVTRDGVEIPSDIMELLELISQLKSFRAACKAIGVSPSTYWERIKELEYKLGMSLLITVRGGRKKGITVLTGFARDILEEYRRVREKVLLSLYT
ncbi:transcriptional regulator, LysR family protein [Thermococcus sp. AM4]|nr:transcriptional regulator, LysR family protein [Thermococcus sp. AM4]